MQDLKNSGANPADDEILSKAYLKAHVLTTETTHLLRRPGVGISEHAASVCAGAEVLQAKHDFTDTANGAKSPYSMLLTCANDGSSHFSRSATVVVDRVLM